MEAFVILLFTCVISCEADQPKVLVQQGWLSGEKLQTITRDGYYYSFKGIPYAVPPIGNLRFKAPRPPRPWKGIRCAKNHGSVCHQINIFTGELIPGNEDCLFLNVYTPNLNPSRPLAVMVFIHGGAYQTGSGNVDNYAPDLLVRKNIIIVTFNYRLNALGFLCLDTDEVPGNAGLKDHVAALRWVQSNIREFGGDPDRVTIFGEDAGGASVGYHLISNTSNGLFLRAISMSGSPYCDWSTAFYPKRRAFKLGQDLGFEAKNENELLNFLQSVEASELVSHLVSVLANEEIISNVIKLTPFPPVVEKTSGSSAFLLDQPRELLRTGSVNKVDVMFGYTDQEGLIMLPLFEDYLLQLYNRFDEIVVPTKIVFKRDPDTILKLADSIRNFYFGSKPINFDTMSNLIHYTSNATFIYDVQRFFRDIPRDKCNNMYFYKFSSVSNRNYYGSKGRKYGITGAAHADDLLYLFDARYLNMTLKKNTLEYGLVEQATTLFSNFAKYGTPTPDNSFGLEWPQFDNKTLKYVNIGQKLQVGSALDQRDMCFWKSIFEYAGVPFFLE